MKNKHLLDVLLQNSITVSVIFAPEHGFRGYKGAGEQVLNSLDLKTGIPIISLHGNMIKPTAKQLKNVDMIVFDIQDVGVRFYTYISTLFYIMESCAENSIPLLVLDRPNPNGDYIAGPVLDLKFQSFVGIFQIPLVHGLTIGELAFMINGEGWLKNNLRCKLKVIPVKNYEHNIKYTVPVKPSPNLSNKNAVRLYPTLALFEGTSVSVGRGTAYPFEVLGYPDQRVGDFSFIAKKINGSWSRLNYAGKTLYGEKLSAKIYPYFTIIPFINWYRKFQSRQLKFITRPKFLDKLAGTDKFRKQVESGRTAKNIIDSWQQALKTYQKMRKKYLLYEDSDYIKLRYD